MKPSRISIVLFVVSLFLAPALFAQSLASGNQSVATPPPAAATGEVPRLIKFSGALLDEQGQALKGPVGVTFGLYAQQTGGAALWMETQNAKPDENGNYVVLLGANSANGVPAELFVSGEARWLGIQVGQQPEHERILLVSVPYALKAGDAETLGGLPASAFVTTRTTASADNAGAASSTSPGSTARTSAQGQSTPNKALSTQAVTPCSSVTSDGTATANSIALFTTACNVQGSLMSQATINGFPGVNLAGNNAGLLLSGTGTHQVQVTGAASSGRLGQDATGFFFSSDTNGKVIKFLTNNGTLNEWMRITSAGSVGIGTQTPAAKLDVNGNVNSNSTISGTQLISTVATGTAPFSVTSTTMVPNLNAAQLGGNAASAFAQLGAASNTFTGGVTAATFTGNGASLTNVNAATLNGLGSSAFAQLGAASSTFTGGVTASSFSGSGASLTNVNAAMLGGNLPSAFALLGAASNTFNGSLSATSLSVNSVTLPATTNSTTGVISLGANSFVHNFGVNDTFVGTSAGNFTTTGAGNSGFGYSALSSISSGTANAAFGNFALSSNQGGSNNAAFGFGALTTNSSGANNSAFGANALFSNVAGQYNSAFGYSALTNSVGSANSGFGFNALETNTTGTNNVAMGDGALQRLGTGNSNIAVGSQSGFNFTGSESGNIDIGNLGTAGESNIIRIGTPGTQTATFLTGNVSIPGTLTMGGLITFASGQAFPGAGGGTVTSITAGTGLTGGTITTSGTLAIDPTVVPQLGAASNTFTGGITASSFTGSGASLTNVNAAALNGLSSSTFAQLGAASNTFSGSLTASSLSSGSTLALPATTSGTSGVITLGGTAFAHNFGSLGGNTFLGLNAGNFSMTGYNNTASGFVALQANTTGANNTADGSYALQFNTTGSYNSANSHDALNANTSGNANTAAGSNSLQANTTGNNNTALGRLAGYTATPANANTTGSSNTFLGFQSGPGVASTTPINNATAIGANALVNCSNCMVLGDSTMPVNVGIRTNTPAQALEIAGNIQIDSVGNGLIFSDGTKQTSAAGSLSGSNTFTGQDVFAAPPAGSGVAQGSVFIDPPSASPGQTLLGVAVGGTQKLLLDSNGTLALSGSLNLPNTASALVGVISLGGTPFIHDFGASNTFVGASAGNMSMTGAGLNTAVGASALFSNMTGTANAALGYRALTANTTGASNAAFGSGALAANTTGNSNSAFGANALSSNTATGNSAFGYVALAHSTTGAGNSAFGSFALQNTTAGANSAFGSSALNNNTTGIGNAAFGYVALSSNIGGANNSAFGANALSFLTGGSSNIAIGANAGNGLTGSESNNIDIGNVGVAGESNTIRIGSTQTATFIAGNVSLPGTLTAASFSGSGASLTNVNAAALNGLSSSTFAQLGAASNTFTGSLTASSLSSGSTLALPATTSGTSGLITLGGNAFAHDYGTFNTFLGAGAGNFSLTGSANTATGYLALKNNTGGFQNTAIGAQALFSNLSGGNNTAVGTIALQNNTTGNNNTALGTRAGITATPANANVTGSSNTFIGYNTGSASPESTLVLNNAAAVGANAAVNCNNCMVLGSINGINGATASTNVGIGTATPDTPLAIAGTLRMDANGVNGGTLLPGIQFGVGASGEGIASDRTGATNQNGLDFFTNSMPRLSVTNGGAVGIGTQAPDNTLTVNGSADKPGGGSWGTFSDARLKNVRGRYPFGLTEVLQLNPILYSYKEQNALGIRDHEQHVGFVAQDVQKVIPDAVSENDRGYLLVNNDPILWAMLNAIKEQQALIERQREQIKNHLAEIARMQMTMIEQRERGQEQEARLRAIELKLEHLSDQETQHAKQRALQIEKASPAVTSKLAASETGKR